MDSGNCIDEVGDGDGEQDVNGLGGAAGAGSLPPEEDPDRRHGREGGEDAAQLAGEAAGGHGQEGAAQLQGGGAAGGQSTAAVHPSPAAVCEECGEHCENKAKLDSHKRIHKKKWCCKKCGKMVAGSTSLKNHKLRCSKYKDDPQFKCQIGTCNFTSVTKYEFNKHLKAIHTVSPTKLHICD